MARVKMVCAHCGSRNVVRDAWAEWDFENQCWELAAVFDAAHCEDCDWDVSVVEKEVEQ